MTVLHDEPNEAPITDLFAFLSIDEHGNEGICAAIVPHLGSTPLVTSKAHVAESMKAIALKTARMSGQRVRLVHFTRANALWSSPVS